MKMIYGIKDKPPVKHLILFALQQILAIISATILVPMLVSGNNGIVLDPAAALFGAGVGTVTYILFTRGKSPVFLGSSFAFISSMVSATAFGYFGIIMGALFAGLVYVIVALIIKAVGAGWINKLLPPVIIGPTIALIGLSLAGSAVNNITNVSGGSYNLISILCGIITFGVTIYCSVKGNKTMRMIPFIIGILAGYVVASLFTAIGAIASVDYLKIVNYKALVNNFSPFKFTSIFSVPEFTFIKGFKELANGTFRWSSLGTIAVLFAPVAFVVLAEHIGDHKNLSSVISTEEEQVDLLVDPGLDKTLLGDGVGSVVGAVFGGCPNTTYGESVGCVAITKNASIYSIIWAAVGCLALSFFSPFVAFIETLPNCVIGGICLALYGFIAVSGLKMLQKVDLENSKNLFIVSAILISGIGGLTLQFGEYFQITAIATALILGIVTNVLLSKLPGFKKKEDDEEPTTIVLTKDEDN